MRAFKHLVFQSHREALRQLGFDLVYRSDGSEAIYSPAKILALAPAELEYPRGYPATVPLHDLSLMVPAALADEGMRARCRAFQVRLSASRAEDRVAGLVAAALS